eukprot:GHVP01026609.1.p1 GENE.GHVP01026609.1~~GHVP01026609.1.p1  ORF type:complete len:349 (+),score=51.34 GHVP01026609.1:20-1066(+)
MKKSPRNERKKKGAKGAKGSKGEKGTKAFREEIILKPKAKTAKGKRVLKSREPKILEVPKSCLILRTGSKTSPAIVNLLKDINAIKTPFSTWNSGTQEADLHPVDGSRDRLNTLCTKNNSATFICGTSTKKRPNRLVFGRQFDNETLDLAEFEVSNYYQMNTFKGRQPMIGSMNLLVCQGSEFESSDTMIHLRNLLSDVFRGPNTDKLPKEDIQSVIVLTAGRRGQGPLSGRFPAPSEREMSDLVISFRRYKLTCAWTSETNARTEECGPSFDLRLDRLVKPQPDVWKRTLFIPPEVRPKKQKNVKMSELGDKVGKVFVPLQDLGQLYTPHAKNIRKSKLEMKGNLNS